MRIINVGIAEKPFENVKYGENFIYRNNEYMRCNMGDKRCGIAVDNYGTIVRVPFQEIVRVCDSSHYTKKLSQVPIGGEFKYGEDIYIKTQLGKDDETMCVSLNDGSVMYLSGGTPVKHVVAEIHIK